MKHQPNPSIGPESIQSISFKKLERPTFSNSLAIRLSRQENKIISPPFPAAKQQNQEQGTFAGYPNGTFRDTQKRVITASNLQNLESGVELECLMEKRFVGL